MAVVIDGPGEQPGFVADCLAETLRAAGRPCRRVAGTSYDAAAASAAGTMGGQFVCQGRSLSGLSTTQMCLIRSPATWNAYTATVAPAC